MEPLALSLINEPTLRSEVTPQTLAKWWMRTTPAEARFGASSAAKPRFNSSLVASVIQLREAIREAFEEASIGRALPSGALEALNKVLRRTAPQLVLSGSLLRLQYVGDQASDAVLGPLAHSALELLLECPNRIRRCAAARCDALFLDPTKNRSRRWCSTKCLERARAPRRKAGRNGSK